MFWRMFRKTSGMVLPEWSYQHEETFPIKRE